MLLELKAFKEALISSMESSSKVFIVGHNQPDYDAIGSAMGIFTLAKSMGKEAYIVIDENLDTLDSKVRSIIEENKTRCNIITLEEFEKLYDDDAILVVTDTNRKYRICLNGYLDRFKKNFVIDHHDIDPNTSIQTVYSYIDINVSSASEAVTEMLLSRKATIPPHIATMLLAGIALDTKRFKNNTTGRTFQICGILQNRKADYLYVNSLFKEDFKTYKKVSNLIINGPLFREYISEDDSITVSFNLNRRNKTTPYTTIDVAKTADAMMKFSDTTFAMGCTGQKQVTISARSSVKPCRDNQNNLPIINAGEILTRLDSERCGGNPLSAGGLIPITEDGFPTIKSVEQRLMSIVHRYLKEKGYQKLIKR